jgi:hypothetical protein
MRFQPKTEEEVQAEQLCEEGDFPFTVLEASEGTSKSGKSMIKFKLNVHADDGDYHIYDYISPEFMAFKFRHFFHAVGLGKKYDAGDVDCSQIVQREGFCSVIQQPGKGGYGPKNAIKDYIVGKQSAAPAQAPSPSAAPTTEDDVPF